MKRYYPIKEYMQRWEAVLTRRKESIAEKEISIEGPAVCEVCGDGIPHYLGPPKGIMCDECFDVRQVTATRIEPLAITRSAIREGPYYV